MKTNLIKKGFHRPLTLLPVFVRSMGWKEFYMDRTFKFTEKSKYNLNDTDQLDWNKLVGVCYGIFGIHKNSDRMAWRYNVKNDLFELAAYWYNNGERGYKILSTVEVGEEFRVRMRVIYRKGQYRTEYELYKVGEEFTYVNYHHNISKYNKFRCSCWIYFGGNRKAPKDIEVLHTYHNQITGLENKS